MIEPKEPYCPPDRRPHKDRVKEVNDMLMEGMTAGICIDDTPEHRAWYLHELSKYPQLEIVYQGVLTRESENISGIYLIKVRKGPSKN